jgi:hypothetical protein
MFDRFVGTAGMVGSRADAQGSSDDESCGVVTEARDVGAMLGELRKRCKTVDVEVGRWSHLDGRWCVKWRDHDRSTGSVEHEVLEVAVREALRRVAFHQEVTVSGEARAAFAAAIEDTAPGVKDTASAIA